MKGSEVPVKCANPKLIKMENSITATKIIGRVMLFSTRAMMIKIATMEMVSTTLKSLSVISIRSLVQGASPMSIPVLSYFFKMVFKVSICAFTSSVAVAYSELTKRSSQSSLFNTELILSGSISSGTRLPTTDSMPSTYLTPSTCSISWVMLRIFSTLVSVLTKSMWVAPTPNRSCSLELAMT